MADAKTAEADADDGRLSPEDINSVGDDDVSVADDAPDDV